MGKINNAVETVNKVERIYHRYRNMIYLTAFDILRDRALSLDAVHDTMVKLMRYADRIDESKPTQMCNYIYRVAKCVSIDMYNKRKNMVLTEDPDDTAEDGCAQWQNGPEEYVITKESVNDIAGVINGMDEKYSMPLRLHKLYKFSIDQTAEMMGVSPRTVHNRINKAKEIIAEALKGRGKIRE